MTLPRGRREAVARAVQRLRTLFEEEFSQQATGTFGLHAVQPWVEPRAALTLRPVQEFQRRELIGAIDYLQGEGFEGGKAVTRLIQEAAFTAINQLLAVRVAEAMGIFPEVTARGRQSSGYRDVAHDLFPLLQQQADEGLWIYIQVCGDELGATVPLLFDRRLPTAVFVPSRTCVDAAIDVLNEPDARVVWADPEALSWAYQFFNRDSERQRMRDESSAPRNSRELAVRNQFCTPWYVVDWLVQNTLGRRLREAGYELDLPLLIGDVGTSKPLALEAVRVLDPAVGSGNFLLGCYDLLEKAWEAKEVPVPPAESAPKILRSLHGIDIDPRASQITQTVLVLRARKAAPEAHLQPPAIATARPFPNSPETQTQVFEGTSRRIRKLAEEITNTLTQASVLGSLLKVERPLEKDLIETIEEVTLRTDATAASRLFVAEARDALRFVQLCQQRYDIVLMNPPFGGSVPGTEKYLKATYGKSAVDLYAAFVHRGVELLDEHGYLGAITSRTGFFNTNFEDWRRELVLPRTVGLTDLGVGVMHNAMVQAAAYVLSAQPHHGCGSFRRLLDEPDKESAVYEGTDEPFVRRPDDFVRIPGSPTAYWLSLRVIDIFRKHRALEKTSGTDVRQGLATADDFRFVRLWWEVPAREIGHMRRWRSFAKGGEYSPYYADIHLIIDWEDDGREIRAFDRAYIRNDSFYFRPGLTWSLRSQKGLSMRPVPAGAIFGHKGPAVFVSTDKAEDLDRLMAYLNSGPAAALLEAMVAFGSYEVGAVQRIPSVDPGGDAAHLAGELTRIRMSEGERSETDHMFVSPWVRNTCDADRTLKLSRQVDEAVSLAVGEERVAKPLSATYPTRWFEEDYNPPSLPTAHHELSYLLGVAFGRWDIRVPRGTVNTPPLPGPYDPLPPTSRGMLVGKDGLPTRKPPVGYPLDVPPERLLHDEPGHPHDMVAAIEDVIGLLETGSGAPELSLHQETKDLRRHLRGQFFADHLKDYSASRRYAPIYWYLAVPSKEWGLWAYAPALSREMLFAIAGAARDKLRRIREQTGQLRDHGGGSTNRDVIERIERLEQLADEIEPFAEHADKVAQSGWQPNLNDGLVLCAAPLEPLFADDGWRRRVAQYRKNLEQNKYPWATVQQGFFRG